jgi:hypothetical protein
MLLHFELADGQSIINALKPLLCGGKQSHNIAPGQVVSASILSSCHQVIPTGAGGHHQEKAIRSLLY